MPAAILEEDLLIPRSNDENSWAEYELSSVQVHASASASDSEWTNTPVSLLHASIGNPLTVTGQLEPLDPSDADLLVPGVKLSNKRINLELNDVCTFSYGELGDGSVAVWAGGKSGWFKIRPGRAYRHVYQEIQEAVKLLYFVADSYKETRKEKGVGRGKKALMLPPYSALELAQKYALEFLGTNDADDAFDKFAEHKEFLIGSMLAGKEGLQWSTYPLWADMQGKFPEVFKELERRLRAKPPKSKAKKPAATDTSSTTKSSQPKPARPRKEAKGSAASSSAAISSKKQGRPRKNAGAVDVITLSDSESSEEVTDTLVQAASDEPKESPQANPKQKFRRTRNNDIETTPSLAIATPAKDDDDSDDEAQMRNKSSLRPRASKGNKGGKGRPREAEDVQSPASSPTQAGDKRKHIQEDSRRPHKRRSSDSPEVEDEDGEENAEDEGIDIPTSPTESQNHVPDNPDSVQENTWICALAGCTHKVYLSHLPASQKLIREHYALHAYDDDERVQMVKRLAQPSLPIGHLMEKVRGQARMDGFPDSTVAVSRFGDGVTQKY
ncbi:uncharacterized protein RCC_00823 [Ramularia collo-cygni]|uniref:DNA (cytosine-5)-methyltransferase 1 replication foci domain-containing protein n=1 Tax=Ramularia collo-cygni TaxID=112498 RepID=A0A2D3UXM8_9PEZI|nr:uncharacterized protein RCC_00823 [Ramularia collo-cygni]CZT14884.1 uncharacterized protein RCC_00823 [Ramularia collo-cygni]